MSDFEIIIRTLGKLYVYILCFLVWWWICYQIEKAKDKKK